MSGQIAASCGLINLFQLIPYSAPGLDSAKNIAETSVHETFILPLVLVCMVVSVVAGKWQLPATTPRRSNIALVAAMFTFAAGIMWQTISVLLS